MISIISALGENKRLTQPQKSSEIVCPKCFSSEFGATFMESPGVYMWFCSKQECLNYNISQYDKNQGVIKTSNFTWPQFCDKFEVGDIYHDLTFEQIDQKQKYLDHFLQFAKKPSNILIFGGETDSGKTFAALGMLEYFSRTSTSCAFYTSESLQRKWLASLNDGNKVHFFDQLAKVDFLVLDDFGQREPPPGFITFVFDVISNRISWTSRGTLITTNLDPDKLASYCKEALANRLQAGEWMPFKAEGRSKNRKSSWRMFK